ncbi:pentapeptide repeat-containing protein [Tolypothrix campylonemoides VB511288_2]|uniref:CHAT domain-containing protein n=3 Tax=Nostocales TaxID=1161 RepID=A0A0C1NIK9_9CYAN
MPIDYSGQNLRGRNFKGLDLVGANFSYADIRSADFTGAILRGANFSHAKAGLQKRWAAFLVLVSWLISGLAGFLSAFVGSLISYIFESSSLENRVSGWAALIAVIVVFIVIIRQGVNSVIAGAVAFAFAFAGAVAFAFAFAFAGAVAFAFAFAGAFVLLSIYISRRSLKGDPKYALIRDIAIAFAAFKGTSFRSADLTDANFTEATLKSTDFRKAILTRTSFHKTKKLDRVRPGSTYLQKLQICQVLVTGLGTDKNFDRIDLRGVNFKNAHLVDASFIGADLSGANLQDADLSRAKLQQTQLDGTDFTGATLTGAYIQDWNITSDTKFDGVQCQYVYMRLPTKENPDPMRKPDNNKEVFGDGEFGDFIKPIFDTLDLYHNQGVDPRAIAISFKQLTENHPEAELRIVGMEVRGEDKFLIKAKTAPQTDKSELSAEYFETYNQLKGLPEQELRLLLAEKEKDSRIRRLENMVQTALEGSEIHEVRTILFLAANPNTTSRLRLDEENRQIEIGLQRAKKREQFDLKQRWAVRVRDVSQALLDFKPQIVHFSGHGSLDDGLALEDETGNVRLVDTQALAKLFKLFTNNVECVVLNACYSEVQAEAIVKHIPYVIGMDKEIGDRASIEFAVGFYAALGAGESIEFAYEFGCNAVELAGFTEHLTPVLKKKHS